MSEPQRAEPSSARLVSTPNLIHRIRNQRPRLDHASACVDATNKQGQGVSEPGQADQPGPGEETRVRGGEERRLDLDRAATIRSARVSSTLSDLGRTTEI
jgi:hypothetical protein